MTRKNILDKKKELVNEVKEECEKLFTLLNESDFSNPSYHTYTSLMGDIKEKADKVLEFNAVINRFFTKEFNEDRRK